MFCALSIGIAAQAQDNPGRALGVVTKIDPDSRQITIKTDAGVEMAVSLDSKASFRKVAPGETNLANAAMIALTDIKTGDRVLARGKSAEDSKILTATLIVVMSQTDIASKQAAERADWDKRGVTGVVTETGADQVTINIRTMAGATPLVIKTVPGAAVRRYAPDSVKFADAKPSKLADIKKGDQVRARGNRAPDPATGIATMTAEEVVSGQFKMIAGVVQSVDAKENVIRINNLETKKPMTVKISVDSSVRRLPPQLAQVIANRLHGVPDGAPAGPGAGVPGGGVPAGGVPGGPAGGPGGGGRGGFGGRGGPGGGDLQSMLDRVPTVSVMDLMMGQAIIVSSTIGASADQVTAITLLAGVEPILTKPGTTEMSLGSWNVGGGGGDLGGLGGFGQ